MMNRIGIDTAFLGNLRAGTWQYTSHLLHGIGSKGGFTVIDRISRAIPDIDLPTSVYPGGGEKLAKFYWPNFILPGNAARDRYDLVHCTTPYGTFMPCRYRNVITICDVTPLLFPETHGKMNVWHYRLLLPAILKRADRIITISECSKQDIVRVFGVPEEKVSITLLAADERFKAVPEGTPGEFIERLPDPYILNVGTLEPRKNLEGLLRAFASAKKAGIQETLVITGAKGWGESHLAQLPQRLGIADSVVFTGFVDDNDLPFLYAGAKFFVYPSLYEGFGLPVLEAMACGTPVITSNLSSIPEVTGDAALLVDPESEAELSSAILKLAGDPLSRQILKEQGLKRAKLFCWEKSVTETLKIYEEVLG